MDNLYTGYPASNRWRRQPELRGEGQIQRQLHIWDHVFGGIRIRTPSMIMSSVSRNLPYIVQEGEYCTGMCPCQEIDTNRVDNFGQG